MGICEKGLIEAERNPGKERRILLGTGGRNRDAVSEFAESIFQTALEK